jgi:hypothetical protein
LASDEFVEELSLEVFAGVESSGLLSELFSVVLEPVVLLSELFSGGISELSFVASSEESVVLPVVSDELVSEALVESDVLVILEVLVSEVFVISVEFWGVESSAGISEVSD